MWQVSNVNVSACGGDEDEFSRIPFPSAAVTQKVLFLTSFVNDLINIFECRCCALLPSDEFSVFPLILQACN
jgi:hypothetical protein